jgi:hypothetical protein
MGLGFLPGTLRSGRNSMGTRRELIRNLVAAEEATGQAVPRFDRCGCPLAVRFRIPSITHTKARDGLEA